MSKLKIIFISLLYYDCAAPTYKPLPEDGIVQLWWTDRSAKIKLHPDIIRLKKILEQTGNK